MKIINNRNRLILLALITTVFQLTAQISITSNDMPFPDDIVLTSTGLNLDFINYRETGENYFWDFSQLIPISQSVDTFISLTGVPWYYSIFFFTSANLAKKEKSIIPIPNFPITNSYTFFNNKDNYFGIAGTATMLYGIPIPLKFNSHDKLYEFPMEYGNTGTSFAEYSIGLPNFGFISKEISRSNIVDGWGTLITPYGTFEVLRQKSEVTEFDSIYIDSLGIGLPIYREFTEYSWLGKGQKIPLLQITSSFGGVIATYIDSARMLPSAINSYSSIDMDEVKIFPVPSHDLINISFELISASDIEIAILNTMGIKVADKKIINQTPGTINIKLSARQFGLNDNIYLLKIISNNQQITKKLILY